MVKAGSQRLLITSKALTNALEEIRYLALE